MTVGEDDIMSSKLKENPENIQVLGCCMHTFVYVIFWMGSILNFAAGLLWMSIMKKYRNFNFFNNILPWMIAFTCFFIDIFMLTPFCWNCFHFLPTLTGKKYYDWYKSQTKERKKGKSLYIGDRSCYKAYGYFSFFLLLSVL